MRIRGDGAALTGFFMPSTPVDPSSPVGPSSPVNVFALAAARH
ncbi:hypothetical protein [Streptomyces collinus]